MGAVHRVAGLEGGHRRPALGLEEGPGLGGSQVDVRVGLGEVPLAQHPHRPAEVDRALLEHLGDAGVGGVGGAEDRGALVLPVDPVALLDDHRAHERAALGVDERDLLAGGDRPGVVLGRRERDRDRPEGPVVEAHLVADPAPVGLADEAAQRGEGADAEHDEVGGLTRGHRQAPEPPGAGGRGIALAGIDEPRLQAMGRAVRPDEAHRTPSSARSRARRRGGSPLPLPPSRIRFRKLAVSM